MPRQKLPLRDSRVFLLRLRHGDGIVNQIVENVEIANAIGLDRRVDDFFCEVALEVEHLFVERHVRRDETRVLASADVRKLNKVAFFLAESGKLSFKVQFELLSQFNPRWENNQQVGYLFFAKNS